MKIETTSLTLPAGRASTPAPAPIPMPRTDAFLDRLAEMSSENSRSNGE
ncbi:MAG: hypothetical protein RAK18_04370 [Conexivisphaerales archaeon]|nr:hypothetical protein [Conexivisphaerales archaeon]